MKIFKNIKRILLTAGITLSLSLHITSTAYASTYDIVRCDPLFKISQIFNTSVLSILNSNNLINISANVGQKLNIQGTSQSTATTSVPKTTPAAPSYSAQDLDLLSRLIMAEAQGEPYEAKVAVGAVVINRVESGSFPKTINEVIYQNINGYYQFTPVVNGWINKPANADSINAAKAALNGEDPTNNALFYYDNTTTNSWILSKPVSIRIGNMIYAY